MLYLLIFQPLGLVRVHLGTEIVVPDDSEQGARYDYTSRGIGLKKLASSRHQSTARVRCLLAFGDLLSGPRSTVGFSLRRECVLSVSPSNNISGSPRSGTDRGPAAKELSWASYG